MHDDRHPTLGYLDLTDADEDTWRLWARVYPLVLLALLGLILAGGGAPVGAAGSVVAAGLIVKVVTSRRPS